MAEKRPDTPAGEFAQEGRRAPEQPTTEAQAAEPRTPKRFYDRSFPTVVDFLVFFGVFLLAQGIGAALGCGFFGWPDPALLGSGDPAVSLPAQLAAGHFNALSYAVAMSLTLAGFLYYRRRRRGPHIIARFSLRGLNPMLLLWGVVFMFSASVAFEPLMSLLPQVPDAYGRGGWMLLTVVVMAPLFEEVIFRGVLLESTRAKYGVVMAWLVSSAIFGLVHTHPTLIANAFVIGMILGLVYIATSSLWSVIILHAVNNALAYLLLVSGHTNVLLIDLVGSRTLYVLIYIAALAVLVISGYMGYRTLRGLKEAEKNHPQA